MANPEGKVWEGVLVTPVVIEVDGSKPDFSVELLGFARGTRIMLAVDTSLPPVTNINKDAEELHRLVSLLTAKDN